MVLPLVLYRPSTHGRNNGFPWGNAASLHHRWFHSHSGDLIPHLSFRTARLPRAGASGIGPTNIQLESKPVLAAKTLRFDCGKISISALVFTSKFCVILPTLSRT